MTPPLTSEPGGEDAARYEIRIHGHLDPRWATWFGDLDLTPQPDGSTLLEGDVPDQAALHGLLQRVRDLGLSLESVTRQDPTIPTSSPANSEEPTP